MGFLSGFSSAVIANALNTIETGTKMVEVVTGTGSAISIPRSIFDTDEFKLPEASAAKRLLASGLLDFDKKMLCLAAVMYGEQRRLSTSIGVALFGDPSTLQKSIIPFIARDGSHVFEHLDLKQAQLNLKKAEEKGFLGTQTGEVFSQLLEKTKVPDSISKQEFSNLSEEDQLKYLDQIDAQKKGESSFDVAISSLSQELVEFWRGNVQFLTEALPKMESD